jgi:hypothetical protein
LIKPTPGRIVYFWPTRKDCPGPWPGDGVPLSAQVAFVHPGDQQLNLAVLEMTGQFTPVCNVPLLQAEVHPLDNADGERSVCTWMPYQQGQAKKHAEEDAAAAKWKADAAEAQRAYDERLAKQRLKEQAGADLQKHQSGEKGQAQGSSEPAPAAAPSDAGDEKSAA